VGGWTAKAIAEAGHSIRFLVRNPDRLQTSVAKLGVDVSDFSVGDITDRVSVREALQGCDAVVHSAALVATDPRQTSEMLTTNMQGVSKRARSSSRTRPGPDRARVELHRAVSSQLGDDDGGSSGGRRGRWIRNIKAQVDIYARGLQDAGAPVNITYPGMVLGPPVGNQYGEVGEGVRAALQMHVIPRAQRGVADR